MPTPTPEVRGFAVAVHCRLRLAVSFLAGARHRTRARPGASGSRSSIRFVSRSARGTSPDRVRGAQDVRQDGCPVEHEALIEQAFQLAQMTTRHRSGLLSTLTALETARAIDSSARAPLQPWPFSATTPPRTAAVVHLAASHSGGAPCMPARPPATTGRMLPRGALRSRETPRGTHPRGRHPIWSARHWTASCTSSRPSPRSCRISRPRL